MYTHLSLFPGGLFVGKPNLIRRRAGAPRWPWVCLLATVSLVTVVRAEDADRFRTYMQYRLGEFSPTWGVKDMRGFSFGANFNEYLGAELSFDAYQLDMADDQTGQDVSEEWIYALAPQVRLRLPLWNKRLVPYVVAGAGVAWVQAAESLPDGFGHNIEGDGTSFSAMGGVGMDLFLADNIAFTLEGKYIYVDPISVSIDGRSQTWNPSAFTASLGLRLFFDENHPRPFVSEESGGFPVRLYFGTQVGVSFLTDAEWVPGAKLTPKPNAAFNAANLSYNLTLGADFNEYLSAEVMLAQSEFNLSLDDVGPVGEYAIYTVMPNLRLRFPFRSGRWVPYILAGGGASYAEFNRVKPKGQPLHVHAKGVYPAFEAGAGCEYFIARNFSFDLQARYVYTWGQQLEIPGGPSGSGDFGQVQVGLGVRLYLIEFKHHHEDED